MPIPAENIVNDSAVNIVEVMISSKEYDKSLNQMSNASELPIKAKNKVLALEPRMSFPIDNPDLNKAFLWMLGLWSKISCIGEVMEIATSIMAPSVLMIITDAAILTKSTPI